MTTFWDRLEPNSRDEDLEEALQARIADPMWMLARQWQVGELRGEDAATPVMVRGRCRREALGRVQLGERRPAAANVDERPLQSLVEAEAPAVARFEAAAQAGLTFLRELAGRSEPARALPWPKAFPLEPERYGVDTAKLIPRSARRVALWARRGVDGSAVLAATDAELERALSSLGGRAHVAEALAARDAARERFAGRLDAATEGAWHEPTLSYEVRLLGAGGPDAPRLSAGGYSGGLLDWESFSLERPPAPTNEPGKPFRAVPTPVTYRGQPTSRHWEYEAHDVYFGGIEAGPSDVARLLVAHFATSFADDWFVFPLAAEPGSLLRIEELWVLDTMGRRHPARSFAVEDRGQRAFRLFELTGDDSADADGAAPWLFVPPVQAVQEGPALERVQLRRDEQANVAWAVEERVQQPCAGAVDRRSQWAPTPPAPPAAPWRYRLETQVPPWWVPLVPELTAGGHAGTLRRGRMAAWELLDPSLVGAQGELFGAARPVRIREEAVPLGGLTLHRSHRAARDVSGRLHVWAGRSRRAGVGQAQSGLRADVLDRGRGEGE